MVAFRPQRSWSASDKAKVRRAALIESSIRRTQVSPAGSFRGIAQNDQMRSRRGSHPCERDVELHVRAQVRHQHPRLDENSAGSPRHAGTMQHDEFADE